MMKAVRKMEAAEGFTVTTAPIPKCGDDEVLIRIKKAAICGTDLHIHMWDAWSQGRIKPPITIGHEFMGEVAEVGANVTGFKKGQRVSAEGHLVCQTCAQCRTGKGHICTDVKIFGVDCDGIFAEYISVPAFNVWPLPDALPDRYGPLFDPLGNAMHTVMAQPVGFKTVLITGAGSIGLFAVAITKSLGAAKIIVAEPNPMKQEVAKQVGADVVLNPIDADFYEQVMAETGGIGVDVLLEMSGYAKTMQDGMRALTPGGDVALLGLPSGDVTLDLNNLIIFKGATVRGINGRKMYETWYQSQEFLLRYGHTIDPILTHTLPLEDINKGIELMKSNQGIKILLDV